MAALKPLLLIASAIVGTSGAGSTGAYFATLTTAKEYLKDDLLDEASAEDWKVLQKKLNTHQNINQYGDIGLKEIQKSQEQTPENGDSIKDWCIQKKEESINPTLSFLPWSNRRLLNAINSFCIQTIENKLENKKLDLKGGSDTEEKLKSNLISLISHSETEKGNLDNELRKLKDKASSDESWQILKEWCIRAYSRGYSSSNTNLFKLAQNYCSRS